MVTEKRYKKATHKALASISFSNTLAWSQDSLPHVTRSLIGRGSLIRWRASFVNVNGILSATAQREGLTPSPIGSLFAKPKPNPCECPRPSVRAQKSPNDDDDAADVDIVRRR